MLSSRFSSSWLMQEAGVSVCCCSVSVGLLRVIVLVVLSTV